ncbi:hypothetical protein ACW7BJ_25340 [Azospirillum argentinense]
MRPAKLAFMGHALMKNHHALIVDIWLTAATGTAQVGWVFTLTATAYNLIRLSRLLTAA